MLRNLRFTIRYDGTDFFGWQTQPGRRTVQETLETVLSHIVREPVRLNASGRTDAGVHALAQVANGFSTTRIPADKLLRAVNAQLPDDVRLLDVADVPESFDANKDALRKRYRYVFHDGRIAEVFLRKYCYHSRFRLDVAAMQQAALPLRGRHDFHSFETDWPNRLSSVRTITHIGVSRVADFVWLDVEADGFLYNMVRAIAGTLYNIGRGFWPINKAAEILLAEDRRQAGPTAPAQGLYLVHVTYPPRVQTMALPSGMAIPEGPLPVSPTPMVSSASGDGISPVAGDIISPVSDTPTTHN